MLTHLIKEEESIYPYLGKLGGSLRQRTETVFEEQGVHAICSGNSNEVLPGSSLFMIHFPYEQNLRLSGPEVVHDPQKCDIGLRRVLQLAFLLEDVHIMEAHGAVATAHTEDEVNRFIDACRMVARTIRKYREGKLP
jgi:glutamate-1-semialdehyde aminotransferase